MEENRILYNNMFTALVVNIYSLSKKEDSTSKNPKVGGYHINFFNPKKREHRLFLQAVNSAATIWPGEIRVNMPLFSFLFWKMKNRQRYKHIHWMSSHDITCHGLNISKEMEHIAKANNQDFSVWNKIADDCGVE